MKMPKALTGRPDIDVQSCISPRALSRWESGIHAATDDDSPNTINIFDVIGVDYWTGDGMTAKRVSGILRSIGADADVTVRINSPGGDMFEGLAIYNLLREHGGEVKVQVLGMAASAASIIAMAGDQVEIARAGFLMIHNAWTTAAGNKNDFRKLADYLAPFDASMTSIYEARTGLDTVAQMMDDETWINGESAIDQGFADALLPSDLVVIDNNEPKRAAAKLDRALAASGMPRSERRQLLQDYKAATPSAEPPLDNTLRAVGAEITELSNNLRSIFK